jgi:hypothetical protein
MFPGVVEVTSIDTVHEPGVAPTWAGTVPPLNDKTVPPATAVTVPPQLLLRFTGFAIEIPGWTPTKLSVQEALVSWNAFGLNMVTLKRETPPDAIAMGVKLLFICAGNVGP